jgi:hypothetical protein
MSFDRLVFIDSLTKAGVEEAVARAMPTTCAKP